MKICIVSTLFPQSSRPEYGVFVENLSSCWCASGHEVTVVSPVSLKDRLRLKNIRARKNPSDRQEPKVFRPIFLSLSRLSSFVVSGVSLREKSVVHAAFRCQKELEDIDFFYGKFLNSGGRAALALAEAAKKPSFLDLGESNLRGIMESWDRQQLSCYLNRFSGIVCVSNELRELAIQFGAKEENVLLSTNAADSNVFYVSPKQKSRLDLGIDEKEFVAVFVGHMIDRKGPRVLDSAVEGISGVTAIFVGDGPLVPRSKNSIALGRRENAEVQSYLAAADVFVLPTMAEGRSNAIEEALSCGVPVISSRIESVMSQLPTAMHELLIDPGDSDDLRRKIIGLRSNPEKLAYMSDMALAATKGRDLQSRATEISTWIKTKLST